MKLFVALSVALLTGCTGSASATSLGPLTVPLTRVEVADASSYGLPAEAARARAAFLKSRTDLATAVPITNLVQFYTTSIGIGNPPTFYDLLIDTGSSNTWCGNGNPYVPTSTSISTGQSVNVTYGSGQFSGIEYLDQVNLAPGLTIANQSIGDALSTVGFNYSGLDGIIGFGPLDLTNKTLSPNRTTLVPTVMDNLISQGLIKNQILGVYFAPPTSDNDTNGALTYGGFDTSLFEGELTYVPLTKTFPASHYWGVNVTNATYGNITVIPQSTAGIVDTGTTQVLLADDFFNAYTQAIPGATLDNSTGLLEIPAASISLMLPLHFVISDKVFTLDVDAQLVPQSQNVAWGGVAWKRYGVVGNMGSLSGDGFDLILGLTFMQRYYAVFDADAARVGFAQTNNTFAS